MLQEMIGALAHIVDVVGIAIIFWGVGVGLVGFVAAELPRGNNPSFSQAVARTRCKVGTYILLGSRS